MTRPALIAAAVAALAALAAPAVASGPALDVTISDRSAPPPVTESAHSDRAAAIFARLAEEEEGA